MEEFIRDHGEMCLELFECPAGVDPLYLSTLCVYFYAKCQKVIDQAKEKVKRDVSINSTGVGDSQQGSHPSENTNESTQPTQPNQPNQPNQPKPSTTGYSKIKPKSKSQYLGGYAGKVMVGSHHQPICIPAGSCKFLVGTVKGVPHKGNFMMEGTQDGNLPSGIAVNNTYVQPTKSGRITVCLQNTNDHNVWIRQPLYAGDLWDMDKEDWEYEPVLVKDTETNNITVKFQQVPPEHLREEIFSQAAEMFGPDKTDKDGETKTKEKEKESDPQTSPKDSTDQQPRKFGPHPDTSSADFDFKMEPHASQNTNLFGKPYLGPPREPQVTPSADGSLNPALSCKYCKDTGHDISNCAKVKRLSKLPLPLNSQTSPKRETRQAGVKGS